MAHISHLYRPNHSSVRKNHVVSETGFGSFVILIEILVIFIISVMTGAVYHFVTYDGDVNQLENYLKLALLVSLIYVVLNFIYNRYKISSFLSDVPNIQVVFKVWNQTFLFVLAAVFLEKSTEDFSRGSVVLFYIVGFLGVWGVRKLFKYLAITGCQEGYISARRIMLVGEKDSLKQFQNKYQPWRSGLKVTDVLLLDCKASDYEDLSEEDREGFQQELDNAVIRARNLKIDEIYLFIPWAQDGLIKKYAEAFRRAPVSIHLGQETILNSFDDAEMTRHGNIASMSLVRPPLSKFEVILKRSFDIIVSVIGLVFLAFAYPVIAYFIKKEDGGDVLFTQPRGGFNGQPFCIKKFRTYKSEQSGLVSKNDHGKDTVAQTVVGDDRVMKIGHFLRKWNIDELPQLWNVLKGDMSIVGPRPHAVQHDEEFTGKMAVYARRHNVKPGITGWAQVTGFRGITDTDDKIKGRVAADLYYIDHWSILLDVYIVFLTVFSKKARENAV